MKIAFIRDEYDPYGGAENFLNQLMDRFADDGAEVHIFARKWPVGEPNGVRFHKIDGPGAPSLIRHLIFMNRVSHKTAKNTFHLVQSYERLFDQDLYRAGDGVHRRWIEIRMQNAGVWEKISILLNPYHHFICYLEKRMFENPGLKAVVTNSNMVRRDIVSRFRIEPSRVITIHNGVDLKKFKPENRSETGRALRESMGVKDDDPVILFVGSGFKRKGLATVIQASALLPAPFQLWVVGKGDFRLYRKMSRNLGVSKHIKYLGPQKDTAPIYAAADVFAFPTLYDPFPSVVLEAMASGLPVVVSKQCGAAEIIRTGKDGFLIESGKDVAGMASFLKKLLNKNLRKKMGQCAALRSQQFSMELTINQYEQLYSHLLKRHPEEFWRRKNV